jgi:aminopeptidase N
LSGWSHIWVNEKGMPEIAASIVGNSLIVSQKDPFGRGLNWPQDLTYLIVPKTGEPEEISVSFGRNSNSIREKLKTVPEGEFHYSEYGWKRVWLFPVERSGCQGLCRLSSGL